LGSKDWGVGKAPLKTWVLRNEVKLIRGGRQRPSHGWQRSVTFTPAYALYSFLLLFSILLLEDDL
jgi:hypothetical protein